ANPRSRWLHATAVGSLHRDARPYDREPVVPYGLAQLSAIPRPSTAMNATATAAPAITQPGLRRSAVSGASAAPPSCAPTRRGTSVSPALAPNPALTPESRMSRGPMGLNAAPAVSNGPPAT